MVDDIRIKGTSRRVNPTPANERLGDKPRMPVDVSEAPHRFAARNGHKESKHAEGYSLLEIKQGEAMILLGMELMKVAEDKLPFPNETHKTAFAALKSALEKRKQTSDKKPVDYTAGESGALNEASEIIRAFPLPLYLGTPIEKMVTAFNTTAANYGAGKSATLA
jgi:hypothetical protein